MRAALWLLALFGIAVAGALFAGNNQGTVTLFWPPYRVDLSLNLVVLLLVAAFVFLHAALRALSALFDLPRQALRWRTQQKERAMHASLLARQNAAARADVAAASSALTRYFDPASARTQAVVTQLQQVQAQVRSVEVPRVNDTLAAIATLSAGK